MEPRSRMTGIFHMTAIHLYHFKDHSFLFMFCLIYNFNKHLFYILYYIFYYNSLLFLSFCSSLLSLLLFFLFVYYLSFPFMSCLFLDSLKAY